MRRHPGLARFRVAKLNFRQLRSSKNRGMILVRLRSSSLSCFGRSIVEERLLRLLDLGKSCTAEVTQIRCPLADTTDWGLIPSAARRLVERILWSPG